jgi:hypothetical protein
MKNEYNEYLYYDTKLFWKRDRGTEMLGVVGTPESLLSPKLPGPYYWDVGLKGGEEHPLWGENFGSAVTRTAAKEAAEKFVAEKML